MNKVIGELFVTDVIIKQLHDGNAPVQTPHQKVPLSFYDFHSLVGPWLFKRSGNDHQNSSPDGESSYLQIEGGRTGGPKRSRLCIFVDQCNDNYSVGVFFYTYSEHSRAPSAHFT